MGSPKRQRKKFSKPSHPWQKERILAEQELLKEYGLNRKYEIWKMNSILKNFTKQAKNLVTIKNPQIERERGQLLTKLSSLGLMGKEAKIEDVLSLTLKDIMERRLQTLVYRKNMAKSFRQARQFIVHEHISLGDKKITAPSYLVPIEDEGNIQFAQGSILMDTNHPERAVVKKEKAPKKAEGKKEIKEETEKKEVKDKKAEKKEAKPEAQSEKEAKQEKPEAKPQKEEKEEKKTVGKKEGKKESKKEKNRG